MVTGPDPCEDRFPGWLEDSEHDYFAPKSRLATIGAALLYIALIALLGLLEACRFTRAVLFGRRQP